jgi:hypothetical protein
MPALKRAGRRAIKATPSSRRRAASRGTGRGPRPSPHATEVRRHPATAIMTPAPARRTSPCSANGPASTSTPGTAPPLHDPVLAVEHRRRAIAVRQGRALGPPRGRRRSGQACVGHEGAGSCRRGRTFSPANDSYPGALIVILCPAALVAMIETTFRVTMIE